MHLGRSEEPRFFAAGLTVVLAPWAWPQVRGWLRGAELIPLLPRAPRGHKDTNVQTPGRAVPADPAEVVPVAMEARGLCHIVF